MGCLLLYPPHKEVVGGILVSLRPSAEGSMNISPWFSRFISDSITLDILLKNDGNFSEVINGTDIRPDSTHLS